MLSSRSLLIISFIYSRVHVSIPTSLSPLVTINLFSVWQQRAFYTFLKTGILCSPGTMDRYQKIFLSPLGILN